MDALAGSDAKLRRADEHYNALDAEVLGFLKANPGAKMVRSEIEKDGLEYAVYLRLRKPADTVKWGLLFGDFTHNLRSALDHAVYELAARGTRQNPPPAGDRLQFPIADDEPRWETALARKQLEGVPDEAIEIIHAAQPYNGGDDLAGEPLVWVRDYDVADKHRFVVPALTNLAASAITVPPGSPAAEVQVATTFSPIDGNEIVRVTFAEPNPHGTVNFKLAVLVTVRHAPSKDGVDLSAFDSVCKKMRAEVARILGELETVAANHDPPPPVKRPPLQVETSLVPNKDLEWPPPHLRPRT